jgi:hypothetical protein
LQDAVKESQRRSWEQAFELGKTEAGDGEFARSGEASVVESLGHPGGVEVEMERGKLDRLQVEGTPGLASQDVAGNGLEVALVSVLADECTTARE